MRKTITELARELRRNPTPAEKKLWSHLRNKQLNGYRFVRQKPLVYQQYNEKRYFFIADFYCARKKLVLELDGKIHDFQRQYDYNRDLVLEGLGIDTLRIKNSELNQLTVVEKKILRALEL